MHNYVVFDTEEAAEAYLPSARLKFPGKAYDRDEYDPKRQAFVCFTTWLGGYVIKVWPVAGRGFVILEKSML